MALPPALELLAEGDRVLAGLIDRHGPPPRRRAVVAARRFEELARLIVHQQLAGKAAASIHYRMEEVLGGRVSPATILAAPANLLTAAGLSRNKAASLMDLAERVAAGEVVLGRIGRLDDDRIVDHLTQVRGIGPWTAHLFSMMALARPDVWPIGDLGVRTGFGRAWGLGDTPTPKELQTYGEWFRPCRSAVAWYCWRAADDPTAG